MTSPHQRKKRLAIKRFLEKQKNLQAANNTTIKTEVVNPPQPPVESKPPAVWIAAEFGAPAAETPKVKKAQTKNALVELEETKQKEPEPVVTPEKVEVKEEKKDV